MTDPTQDAATARTNEAKQALRRTVAARIAALKPQARAFGAQRAAGFAQRAPALAHARLVLCSRAMSDEIDTDPLTRALTARAIRVAFPAVTANGKLTLLEVSARDVLEPTLWTTDHFGIRAPRLDSPCVRAVHAREVDAVIVPLRACDVHGARLGRGKGFYDRLLASLRADARANTIGFAFDTQVVSEVPRAAHDRAVAWIATERRLLRAKRPQLVVSSNRSSQ